MKSAIGNSLLLNIVIIIVTVVIILFISIISYSKAYRVKNGIIEILERNDGYSDNVNSEIRSYLKQVGYQTGTCPKGNNEYNTGYKICLEKIEMNKNSNRFKVTSYVEFNLPIVGPISSIAVTGETRTLNKNYEDYD